MYQWLAVQYCQLRISVSVSVLLVLLVCTHVGVNVRSFCKLGTDGTLVKLLQGNKLRDLAVMK